jgi:hypothetical protein
MMLCPGASRHKLIQGLIALTTIPRENYAKHITNSTISPIFIKTDLMDSQPSDALNIILEPPEGFRNCVVRGTDEEDADTGTGGPHIQGKPTTLDFLKGMTIIL